MKIRAAVLDKMGAEPPYATSKPLRIAELELDPPGRGELLVRVVAAGLCHSDLSVINGDRPRPMPMALGHESAGVVEALWKVAAAEDGINADEHGLMRLVAGLLGVSDQDSALARQRALAGG